MENSTRIPERCSGSIKARRRRRLAEAYPELLLEWDYTKNKDCSPESVSSGSHKKVWWVCRKCSHEWKALLYNRSKLGNGCPACSGRVATSERNIERCYPHLVEEWDVEKNDRLPRDYLPGSDTPAWWLCGKCGYGWKSLIHNRVLKGKGCPACANQVVTEHNNLFSRRPELAAEWDYSKNAISPKEVLSKSSLKVWWKCKECGYGWRTSVNHRAGTKPTGCPACANRVVTSSNNLAFTHPYIVAEWDFSRNKVTPLEVVGGSDRYVWWVCLKCSYSWKSSICNRLSGRGCPSCARGNVSRVSQEWLDSLSIPKKNREVYIKTLGLRVDGYDPETNTVYEFLGDFWHGNLNVFDSREINSVVKKSYGLLNAETMNRLSLLEKSGYNVVYIWESDYHCLRKGEAKDE